MLAVMRGVGRFAVRFRYLVIAAWLAATALCVVFLPSLASVTNSDNSAFLPADSPTAQAMRMAAPFVPPGESSAILVASGNGPLTSAEHSAFTGLEGTIATLPDVGSVTDQGLSADGEAAKAQIVVTVAGSSPDAGTVVDDIRGAVTASNPPAGLSINLTGQVATSVDNERAQEHAQNLTEILSNAVILVMLLLVYRAVLATLVTLIPAVLVLTMSAPVIAESTRIGVGVSSVTHPMLTVLLLGAGTDYGLFLVLRMREETAKGLRSHDAIVRAVERVGESISFSAGTVIAALLCLLLASFGLYKGLGPALAIGVGLMLLAALTLLPALLAVLAPALFWPRRATPTERESAWVRVSDHVLRRPKSTLAVGVLILGGLATGLAGYSSSGFGGTTTGPAGSGSAEGQAQLATHYPPAVVNPTVVLFSFPASVWQNLSAVQTAENGLAAQPVFTSVNGLLDPNGTPVQPQQLAALYAQLGAPGLLPPSPPPNSPVPPQQYAAYRAGAQFVSPDGRTVQFYTALSAGDPSSTAALNAVPAVRGAVTDVQHSAGATASGVNGLAPVSYDVSHISTSDLEEIVPVVLVLIALLLGLVMRSVTTPIYLVVSVALSYFAALGLAVVVYVELSGDSGLDFVLPFLMFVFLMALGEDYNILVMSRIREEAHHLRLRQAVTAAIHRTGTTVTAAGMILAATFAVSGLTGATREIQQLGGAIALGVLLDTFLVRVLLVPSMVILLGRWNWWPSVLFHTAPRARADRTPAPSPAARPAERRYD